MELSSFLTSQGWNVVETLHTEPRPIETFAADDLNLSPASQRLLEHPPISGHIYWHQKEAITRYLSGQNVCMSTGTASGKTLAFHVAALEELANDPQARIIASYPMKALGREQEERWREALDTAGLDAKVGRIDGSVRGKKRRLQILRDSRVLIFTPDIIHAWLLAYVHEEEVRHFLSKIALIIVDEVHTYTGVFGSNAAFLFRRLRHLMDQLGTHPRFFCASATIAEPKAHLRRLIGLPFTLIDESFDSSPKQPLEIALVDPPGDSNFLTEITDLLAGLQGGLSSRFITFVDSRVQVEHIANILGRRKATDEDEEEVREQASLLEERDVLPYRAGYEQQDRDRIQKRLNRGTLGGVISTSALELGVDIKNLDTCVLLGVPYSATSLHQRIGRIGRHAPGQVIVVNGGAIYDQAVFAEPASILDRPLAESALYLENRYIQYIHALCLARLGGEHDKVSPTGEEEFKTAVEWPEGFRKLCRKERLGEISAELQTWKASAGEIPNHTFPLRDIESQFDIEKGHRNSPDRLGSLSFGQLMREAYPGAIYYHLTRPYRVLRVHRLEKRVRVKPGSYYSTRPNKYSRVFPNLSSGNTYDGFKQASLSVVECDLQIQEFVRGFRERRGSTENVYNYPLHDHKGVYYDQDSFSRYYFTTGVILTHPALDGDDIQPMKLAELIYEAFLLLYPFERQDINYATDQHQADRKPIAGKGDRFVAIYDQTYGSLRLTQRLMAQGVVPRVLWAACEMVDEKGTFSLNAPTRAALGKILLETDAPLDPLRFGVGTIDVLDGSEEYERVILPGSKGLDLRRNNEEFFVQDIKPGPRGLRYVGQPTVYTDTTAQVYADIDQIAEIPGVSEIGLFNYDTLEIGPWDGGVIETDKPVSKPTEAQPAEKRPPVRRTVDVEKLELVLARRFNETMLRRLSAGFGLRYDDMPGSSHAEKASVLIWHCQQQDRLVHLLQAAHLIYQEEMATRH